LVAATGDFHIGGDAESRGDLIGGATGEGRGLDGGLGCGEGGLDYDGVVVDYDLSGGGV